MRDVLADRGRQPDVETDADHRRRRAERVAVQLDQDAAELQVAMDEVVRPLERDAGEALGLERADDRDADRERQAGEEAGALLEVPAEREREAAAGDRRPAAAAPAAAGALPFGGERDAVDVAPLRAAQQLGRRRVDLVDDLDGERRRGAVARESARCAALDRVLVEEVGRFEEPITAPLDALEREPGRLGVLQHLRDAGAREPHLGGEVLAGVEGAIGELAQQRESERSEH